jgi:hypothetical protein
MKINDFLSDVLKDEAGSKQVDVAQASQLLRIINKKLWGIPYFLIRWKQTPAEKMRGQKGEALTIALVAIIGTLLVTSAIPSLNIVGKVFGGGGSVKAPAEEAWKDQTQITEPVVVGVTPAGDKVIAFKQTREFRSGASKSSAKMTYGERVGAFLAGMTNLGIIGLVIGFLFFGLTPGMVVNWIKNRRIKRIEADKAKKEQALTNTVAALRDVPPDLWAQLKPLLAAKQDRQDKVVIDEVKAKLH